jgi:hypothetical protein
MFSADQGARKFQTPIAAIKIKEERSPRVKRPYGACRLCPEGTQGPVERCLENEEKSHAKTQRRKG